MSPSQVRKQRSAKALHPDEGGYRKGEETRKRILAAALDAFGSEGFASVTTRKIAEAAGVNLPGLSYYFGNKEGLYLACAQDIVAAYREGVGTVAAVASAAFSAALPPHEARVLLKRLFAALARFLLTEEGAESRALFVQREMASPGPAFEILYAELWRPGIELAAALIERAAASELSAMQSKVRAVMMIASLTGFRSGQRIIARAAGRGDHIDDVVAVLEAQVDSL